MSDQEIKSRILETAADWFYRYGFSRVTMDELAEKMAMSKKTLYKYFASKDDLVQDLVQATMKRVVTQCEAICTNQQEDIVDRLKHMMTYIAVEYQRIGKPLLEDLQRHSPYIWKQIDTARREHILRNFAALLHEGREKGIFRKDIDQELVLLVYTNIIRDIINPEILTRVPFSADQVFAAVVKIFYEGIMTEEGRAKYLQRNSAGQQTALYPPLADGILTVADK